MQLVCVQRSELATFRSAVNSQMVLQSQHRKRSFVEFWVIRVLKNQICHPECSKAMITAHSRNHQLFILALPSLGESHTSDTPTTNFIIYTF